MDNLEELLPGIEDFLVTVLAGENLSQAAEEKRQYFVERLDILKLPPSIPPRPGRKSVSDVVDAAVEVEAEVHEEVVTDEAVVPDDDLEAEPDDFAAYQRELSRTLVQGAIPPTQNSDTESEQGVKVYDDIDLEEHLDGQDSDDKDELYEIPVARLQLSEDSAATGNQSGDRASLGTAASIDDIPDDMADIPLPPPLPPRRDRAASDVTNQNSAGEDKPPSLPARSTEPHSHRNISERSDKSEKSDRSDDHTEYALDGGGDSTSYESYDEDNQDADNDMLNKLNIKLPKRPKKKQNKLKKKLSKSRSSSNWEINVPFKKLEEITLSGDLQYKGKLSWTKKLVALSNGNLACYKPDKETKPQLVVHLTGYEASIQKDTRKGYEIRLIHSTCDSHTFSVDFKEWAQIWMEHINNMAQGLSPPGPYQHLARSTFTQNEQCSGSKPKNKKRSVSSQEPDLNASNSNLSTSSEGVEDGKSKLRGNKVMRMGSFAYRATQFFESLGKKSGKRKMAGLSVPLDSDLSTSGIMEECSTSIDERPHSTESAPANFSPVSDSNTSVFEDSDTVGATGGSPPKIKHQGYLNIFSSFNRRRWGKRWCLVRENMFECYRNEKAKQYELNLLLRKCVFRRAMEETSSELALMLLEDGKEKITVEPMTREEMVPWIHVLMAETSTEKIPDGLEEYFTEDNHSNNSFADLLGYSVIKSWDLGNKSPSTSSLKVVSEEGIPEEEEEDDNNNNVLPSNDEQDGHLQADVYSEINKKGKNSVSDSPGSDERKHTTDSGFYSVKGSNSDSESDSGCILRSEEESTSVTLHSKELTPALSPGSKKRANGAAGLHIRFSLDTESIEEADTGDYDAIEVKLNDSQNCEDVAEESTSHSELSDMKDDVDSEMSKSELLNSEISKTDLSDVSRSELSDSLKSDFPECKSDVNDSIEISKCDMLNSSSDCETVRSSTASVVSLSDKLEQNASAVSSDLEDEDHEELVIKSDTEQDECETSEGTLENTENVQSSSCHSNSDGEKENDELSEKDFEESSEKESEGNTKPSEIKPSTVMEDFDKDIQRRIGRLREKLVQIKRKRIAVRDKRQRASSEEEEKICEEEYSHLDTECHDADDEIARLEQQLSAQAASLSS